MLEITPLHPLFAARVTGLDLKRGPSEAEMATIHEAFERSLVLVFPDQDIDDTTQIAFSERFGPLETTKPGTSGAGSPLVILTNLAPDGRIVASTDRQILNNKANQIWHADSSFKAIPARASMLSGREVPSQGGDTFYANMRAAWAELPDDLKRAVTGKVAVHDFSYSRSKIDPHLVTDEERRAVPPVRQAMVLDHGKYGKSLYIGAHAARIEGMDEAESRALLDRLTQFATQERFVYCHRWKRHDLVLWHNRAVLHRATPFRSSDEKRHMVRTTIAGDSPTLAAAAQ
jgi:alpha-ketoglutarate-dependent 2,4-dichlorophenoxyacetate dioxygenase